MPYSKQEIIEKYDGIDAGGKASAAAGTISPFLGFGSELARRFNVSLLLDEASCESLRYWIIEPLQQLKFFGGDGVEFMFAGRDFPEHITLQEGILEDQSVNLAEQFEKITVTAGEFGQIFVGHSITFDRLLMDKGGSLIIATTEIMPSIIEARHGLTRLLAGIGFKPLSLDNILHSSQVRVTGLPTDDEKRKAAILSYRREVERIQAEIIKRPLILKVGGIHVGSALSLVTRK